MTQNRIDAIPPAVLRIEGIPPDVEKAKLARRWLMGAAKLLADASNGDPVMDRLAREASLLSTVADVVIHEYQES